MVCAAGNWSRPMYELNPTCPCIVCANGGEIPFPGAAETLGYAQPHMPPNSRPPWEEQAPSDFMA